MRTITRLYWLRTERIDLLRRIEEYDNKIQELSNLSSAPVSDMPKSLTVGNPTDKYVAKLIDLKDKKQQLIFKSIDIEDETEEYIKKVDDSEIRTLMRYYFIDGKSWNEIARVLYKRNCIVKSRSG